jgi:predicted nucleic acid-binding protein
MPKPTVYLETTIIGYLANRPFTDVTLESHRQETLRWWAHYRTEYELLISQIVLDEISKGDPIAAADRLALVANIPLLPMNPAIASTADTLLRLHALPPKALYDALHISTCAHHKVDILLTWNCTHIANPHILKLVRRHFSRAKLSMPEIATPEGLLGAQNAGSDN